MPNHDEQSRRQSTPTYLYACPNDHRWRDESGVAAPLANIKCPHCGTTAMVVVSRTAKIVRHPEHVQPLRTLTADVPVDPGGSRDA